MALGALAKSTLFTLVGEVELDTKKAEQGLDNVEEKAEKTQGKFGKLQENAGKLSLAFGGIALAAGAALLKIGSDFQAADNIIRQGTGASGEALKGLQEDFRETAKQVPQSLDVVAQATADLNTELALNGEQLQDASKVALDYARVNNTDVSTSIKGVADTMGIFNVPAEEFAGTLDKLTVLSQATGVGVDKLTSQAQTFGPIWKNMGFEMDEAVAIMANMEAKGIDVSRVMPALNAASRKWAEEGITDIRGELEKTVDKLANTEDAQEKLTIAQDAFGADGAQRMINFIEQEGFALDDLNALMADSEGTVESLGKANLTLGERFGIFRNKAMVGIEPLATAVLSLAIAFLDKLFPAVDFVAGVIDRFGVEVLIGGLSALIPIVVVLTAAMWAKAAAAGAAAIAMVAAAAPALALIAAFAALGVGITLLIRHWDTVTERVPFLGRAIEWVQGIFNKFTGWLKSNVFPVIEQIADTVQQAGEDAEAFIRKHWGTISAYLDGALSALLILFRFIFDAIELYLKTWFGIVQGLFDVFVGVFTGDWDRAWNGVKQIFTSILDGMLAFFELTLKAIKDFALVIWQTVERDAKRLWTAILTWLKDTVNSGFNTVKGYATGLKDGIIGAFKDTKSWLTSNIQSFFKSTVPGWFKSGFNGIIGLAQRAVNKVFDGVSGIARGVAKVINKVADFIPGVSGPDYGAKPWPLSYISIPKLAKGTRNFAGGLAMVGEKGKELVNLPRGAGVLPNRQTEALLELIQNGAPSIGFGLGDLKDWGSKGVGAVRSGIGKVAGGAMDKFRSLVAMGVEPMLNAAWGNLVKPALSIIKPDMLKDILIGAGEWIKDKAIDAIKGAVKAVEDAIGQIGMPAAGRITQRFGRTAFSGIYASGLHSGIDIANVAGTPIKAAGSGDIVRAGWRGGLGLAIEQAVGDLRLLYGHMSKLLMRTGQFAMTGDTIGLMGTTGFSTGNHLHFEIRKGGRAIDPAPFLGLSNGAWNLGGDSIGAMLAPGEMVAPTRMAEALRDILRPGALRGLSGGGTQNIQLHVGDETLADLIIRGNTIVERTGRVRVSRR